MQALCQESSIVEGVLLKHVLYSPAAILGPVSKASTLGSSHGDERVLLKYLPIELLHWGLCRDDLRWTEVRNITSLKFALTSFSNRRLLPLLPPCSLRVSCRILFTSCRAGMALWCALFCLIVLLCLLLSAGDPQHFSVEDAREALEYL